MAKIDPPTYRFAVDYTSPEEWSIGGDPEGESVCGDQLAKVLRAMADAVEGRSASDLPPILRYDTPKGDVRWQYH